MSLSLATTSNPEPASARATWGAQDVPVITPVTPSLTAPVTPLTAPFMGPVIVPVLLLVLLVVGAPCAVFASSAPTPAGQAPAEHPFALLERMAKALETTDFEGTFVYQFGDSLSAMRIVHRHQDGDSQESLLTLNGPIRTIGRNGQAVACLLSGGQSVLLHRKHPSTIVEHKGTLPTPDWRALSRHYRFTLLAPTRVAGRAVDVVDITPRDNLRYGYRFSIDRASGLPLRTALTDAGGRPIQQLMFTDLRLGGDGARPKAATGSRSAPPQAPDPSPRPPESAPESVQESAPESVQESAPESGWIFNRLPNGFQVISHEWIDAEEARPLEHFLLGDGLASVSVYVEQSEDPGLVGQTQMAAIQVAGKWWNGYQITAVGEVPAATVTALIDAIGKTAAH